MKVSAAYIFILFTLFVSQICCQKDVNIPEDRQKLPYQWGQMKMYRQGLSNVQKEAHFNETKEFEFPFYGYRTTYNMKIQDYDGEGTNPCQVQPRYVDIEFDRLDTGLGLSNNTYVAMHSVQDYLVVFTKDFKVLLFSIVQFQYVGINIFPLAEIQIQPNLLSPFDISTQNVTITNSYNGRYIHLFFPAVMFTFEVPALSSVSQVEIKLFKNSSYKIRKNIVAAKFAKGFLFVSAGDDGIDVYRAENKLSQIMEHVANLNYQSLKLTYPIKALDLALDYSSRLYIVCPHNGVIIYEIDEVDFSRSNIVHIIGMLKNASQIAVRGDHTLVVTGNNENDYFIIEVFYDIETNDYFINRQFSSPEFKWTDVQMGDIFTFIQGKGYHRILYQGINKQLIPQEDKHSDFRQGVALQELDLYEVKQIQSVQQGATSFIAISESGIFSIELTEIPPKVICKADDRINIGESKMRLVFNTTDCLLATFHSPVQYNVWQMCQTDFQFTFVVHDIWIDSQNISVAGFIAAIIVLAFIVVILSVTILLMKFKKRFQQSETELLDIKQKYMVLESRTNTQQNRDQSAIQDRSNLQFNNPNQLDTSALR